MADDPGNGQLDGLSLAARARLERFAAAFDRLDASQYSLFATHDGDDPAVVAAMQRAAASIGTGSRRAALKRVVGSFQDAASQAYSRRLVQTDTILLFQSLTDRPDDRVRFLASLERAVIALALWDELEADDHEALVGPWARIVDGVVAQDERPD